MADRYHRNGPDGALIVEVEVPAGTNKEEVKAAFDEIENLGGTYSGTFAGLLTKISELKAMREAPKVTQTGTVPMSPPMDIARDVPLTPQDATTFTTGMEEAVTADQETGETTGKGILSAIARGGGQTGVAAGIGALGSFLTPGVNPATGAKIGAGMERLLTPLSDVLIPAINETFGTNITPGTESWNALMDKIGAETPDTPVERAFEAGARGAAEGVGMTGIGTGMNVIGAGTGLSVPDLATRSGRLSDLLRRGGTELAAKPVSELVSSVGAETAAAIAREGDQGPIAQLAAAVGGGILGGFTGAQVDNLVTALANKAPLTTEMWDLLDAAEAMGINVRTSDLYPPQTRFGMAMQELLEDIPGGTRAQLMEQNTQRINAVKKFASQFGAGDAGYVADDVAADWWKLKGDKLSQATGLKDEVIDIVSEASREPVYTGHTVDLIQDEIDRITQLDNAALDADIMELNNWKEMIQGKNLRQIESHRRYLSNLYNAQGLDHITEESQKFANEVYKSLREDMGEYILNEGTDANVNQWNIAMRRLKDLSSDLDDSALTNAFNTGQNVPEAISNLVTKERSTVQKLYDRLTPEGRDRVVSNVWANWIENATDQGQLSVNKLSQQISDSLTSSTGNQSLLPFFKGDDYKAIEGLQKVIDVTAGAERSMSKPPFRNVLGKSLVIPGASYAIARWLGGGGNVAGLAAAGGTAVAAGKLAQAFEQPTMRNLLIQLREAPSNSSREMELVKRFIDIVRTDTAVPGVEAATSEIQQRIQNVMPEYMRDR